MLRSNCLGPQHQSQAMEFNDFAIRRHVPDREIVVDSSRNRDASARAQSWPTMTQLNKKPLIPIAWARAVAVGATAGAGGAAAAGDGAGRVGGGAAAAGARAAGAGAGAAAARTCGATSARPAPVDSKLIRN